MPRMNNAARFPFTAADSTLGEASHRPELPITLNVLLGQVNFFLEFDACFYRSHLAFEIRPRQA